MYFKILDEFRTQKIFSSIHRELFKIEGRTSKIPWEKLTRSPIKGFEFNNMFP